MAIGIGLHCWYCDHGPCNGECNQSNYKNENDLSEAKRKLYSLLLNMNPDDMSDLEVDMMHSLSKDKDIQKKLKNG